MFKALIWGFEEEFIYPAITRLADENIIEIKCWLGFKVIYPHCTHEANDLRKGIVPDHSFRGYDVKAYNYVYDFIIEFIDQYSRHFMPNKITFHEYINLFNMYFDYYFNYIQDNKIDFVLFNDVPHDGVDLIIYLISKYLNKKIIIVSSSLFSNQFFCVSDIDDYGVFKTIQLQQQKVDFDLENKFEKNLFYMKKLKRKRKLNLKKRLWKIKRAIQQDCLDVLIKMLQKYSSKKKYQKNLNAHSVRQIDLNRKFVYFPLHLQPEMTSSILGKQYVDQLLAVERIRMLIPDDWQIYIKENPKQKYFMRDEGFFTRLARIPNAVLVDRKFNTYELLKNCQFVATITGTVGWEAITGGKSVLIFGDAWYKNFPGVFTYREYMNIEEFVNFTPRFEDVQAAHTELRQKMPSGIIAIASKDIVLNYSDESNQQAIYDFLRQTLSDKVGISLIVQAHNPQNSA